MEDPRCELCADPTPARLLHRVPDQGWDDGLCPACWMLNQPPAAVSIQTTTDAQRAALRQQLMLTQYAMAWQAQQLMLTQYAMACHAQQQAVLGAGLGGSDQPAQASGFGGLGRLCS